MKKGPPGTAFATVLGLVIFCIAVKADTGVSSKGREFSVRILDRETRHSVAARIRFTDAYNCYIAPCGHPERVEQKGPGVLACACGTDSSLQPIPI